MSWSQFAFRGAGLAWCGILALAAPRSESGQNNYATQGTEYPIAGTLPGDQMFPDLSLNASGGFLVWEDNATDGDGWGISALRLDGSLSGTLSSFRVNQLGAFDQEHPRVAMLNGGGAVFVWQGGQQGFQRIYARFLSASNTWATGDVLVNTFTNNSQVTPAVAVLPNGNVVVAWGSFDEVAVGSLQDVYAQLLSPAGAKIGGEFLVNQTTALNQRSPALAPLSGGGFVVVWVSESQQQQVNADGVNNYNVDIYARLYNASGVPTGNEFLVNPVVANVCANPSVAPAAGGGFMVAWMQKDLVVVSNSWDVFACPFSAGGVGGTTQRVNTTTYGDQYAPRVSAIGTDFMVVWTSLGQDGSREGVYGQFLRGDGSLTGSEFRVNTTTISQQMQPAVASDGIGRFLVMWTSFVGGLGSFDLYAQRYASTTQPLNPPDPPFVFVLSSNALSVTWPALAGFSVANYQVFADGAVTPTVTVTNNFWTMRGLAAGSTHYFQLAYALTDGRQSPLSGATTNTTYDALTWGGVIPYDWMIYYFGSDVFNWPSPYAVNDGYGVNLLNAFLAGTDPTNPNTVLRIRLQPTAEGLFLNWNTEPGLMYQLQVSTDLSTWSNLGGPRFAAGYLDSIYVGGAAAGNYRVMRLR